MTLLADAAPLMGAPSCELVDLVGAQLTAIAADVCEALECDRGHEPMEVPDVRAGEELAGSVVLTVVTADGLEAEIEIRNRRD